MKSKNIRLIMELIFIFIIPLLICCLCVDVNDTYVYDNSGNFQTGTKTISFTSPLNYVKEEEYINYLDFNQLCNNGYLTYNNMAYDSTENKYYIVDKTQRAYLVSINNVVSNHKYFICFNITFSITNSTDYILSLRGVDSSNNTNTYFYLSTSSNSTTYDNDFLYYFLDNTADIVSFNIATFKGNGTYDSFDIVNCMLIDLTQMFGSGYEPNSLNDLSNYVDTSLYHDFVVSEEISYYSDDIISSNYTYNYTYIGHIKSLFTNYLELNDSVVLDFIMCYTMLWLLMFIIWHLFYRVFDAVAHLVKTKGD